MDTKTRQDLLALANDLHQARLHQARTKEDLLKAKRRHEQLRAAIYIRKITTFTHYKATAATTIETSVAEAKQAMDQAEIENHKAWVECNRLGVLLGIERLLLGLGVPRVEVPEMDYLEETPEPEASLQGCAP